MYCDGTEAAVVNNRYCHVPLASILRKAPYNLEYNDLVVAQVSSKNAIGWAYNYSPDNTIGALIQIEPSQMSDPFRGSSTDDTRIQIDWVALTGSDTGGATILSYNLELEIDGVMTEVVGASSYFQDTSYTVVTDIVSGDEYTFRLRPQNKWGYGPWSNRVIVEASTNPLTESVAPTTTNSGANILI